MKVLDGHTLSPKALVVVGAFLVVSLATTAAFAQAITGHVAAMHAPSADVTVTGYEVTDDRLELTVRFHNPAIRDVELSVAQLNVYVDGQQVSDGTTSRLETTTVPSEVTETVTVPVGLREGGPERLRNADSGAIEIRGDLKVYVGDELVYVPVDQTGVAA